MWMVDQTCVHKLNIEISDDAFQHIRSNVVAQQMIGGGVGAISEFAAMIVSAIEEKNSELKIIEKKTD